MKNKLVIILSLSFFAAGLFVLTPAYASVPDWQKGVTIYPRWNTDFESSTFQESVKKAKATGINYITLHITIYQSNIHSTDIQSGWNTPTDEALRAGINFIHGEGLKVMLKFQVVPYDGNWSALINPGDRTGWFTNYGNLLIKYAKIAQETGVEQICLGTELINMTSKYSHWQNTQNWLDLIGKVRSNFSGKLTYSANWGGSFFAKETTQIDFWSALDYLGIAAYYSLSGDGSVSSLVDSWNFWNRTDISLFQKKWEKPILFTEIGYKNIYDSYNHPWMWFESGSPAPEQQARDYEALFLYWDSQPEMAGVHFWNWSSDPNAGGSGDIDYTPQNKLAEITMGTWFTKTGGVPPPAPPPTGIPVYTASASMSPSSLVPGANASFNVSISNTNGVAASDIIDIEIYNSGGVQVFQKIFDGEQFTSNSTKNYSASWIAGDTGTYTLKVGVFSTGWTQLYFWGDGVLPFNVGAATPPPEPPLPSSGTIDIWWPTDGIVVSGVLPFKAMLQDLAVENYNMFWQVDSGGLVPMLSEYTDYPHKEASVDVSGWNWKDSGSYIINFVAQNMSGQTLSQKSININVAR